MIMLLLLGRLRPFLSGLPCLQNPAARSRAAPEDASREVVALLSGRRVRNETSDPAEYAAHSQSRYFGRTAVNIPTHSFIRARAHFRHSNHHRASY